MLYPKLPPPHSVSYTYNADGQQLTRTWARGIVTTFTYDAAGRINHLKTTMPRVILFGL